MEIEEIDNPILLNEAYLFHSLVLARHTQRILDHALSRPAASLSQTERCTSERDEIAARVDALEDLAVRRYTGLVIDIVDDVLRRAGRVDIAALIESGGVGLLAAIRKFDAGRHGEFREFSDWYIRGCVEAAAGLPPLDGTPD